MTKKNVLTTPFGTAGFCALSRPSTKFKPDGEYSAQVILPEGQETDAFIATLEAAYEKAYADNLADAQKELDDKARKAGKTARQLEEIKRADKPFKRPVDPDTDEKLPGWVITARLGAVIRDGKDGPIIASRKPMVLDAKGKPVFQQVGSGSTIRIQFSYGGFFTAAVGSGLSFKLMGVQVKELVSPGVGKAEFGEVEGFEESQSKASDPVEHTHSPEATETADVSTTENEW